MKLQTIKTKKDKTAIEADLNIADILRNFYIIFGCSMNKA